MCDLRGQYLKIKPEIDAAIQQVIDSTAFIKGKEVGDFQDELARYLGVKHVIGCANGTDALQVNPEMRLLPLTLHLLPPLRW